MTIFDIIFELADVFYSWRVYLCVIPTVLLAWLLHDHWPEARWLYFLTVPSVLGALVLGLRWEYRAS
jgi:hypothetical protein